MDEEKKKLPWWATLAVLGALVAVGSMFIYGYYEGYTDEQLNLNNGILFCESMGKSWCWQGHNEIACGEECWLGFEKQVYGNPSLKLIGSYNESWEGPE